MASVMDFTGSDGILRSLLTKTVNNKPIPLYPRTSADIVLYDNTTVKEKLDDILSSFSNLSALLSANVTELKELKLDMYGKSFIDDLISRLDTSLDSINSSIITINTFINNLNYFTQEEITQKILSLNETFSRNIANIAVLLDEVSVNLSSNHYTTRDIDNKIVMINQNVEAIRSLVNRDITNKLLQFNIDVSETINSGFANYYTKPEIDTNINKVSDNITILESTLSVLRGDTITMNANSISNINEHTDTTKQAILLDQKNRTATLQENLNSQIDNQTSVLTILLNEVLGAVNSINSANATRINNIYSNLSAQIRSLGGTGGVAVTYDNADEEEF